MVPERDSENPCAPSVNPGPTGNPAPTAGKRLEALARRLRTYLSPAHRRAFRELRARGMSQRKSGEPIVCFDFSDQAIDAVGGRYYFSLVLDFIHAGYFPVFTARRETVSTFGTSKVKSMLLEQRLGVVDSTEAFKEPFVLVTDDPSSRNEGRRIFVDYTWRLPAGGGEIALPVFVHPRIAIRNEGVPESSSRTARIFFGGNTEEGKYDKNVIGELYGMLTRREMLGAVGEMIPAGEIFRPASAGQWLGSEEKHRYVLCETQYSKIPADRWLEAMSRADFFLACPGVGMPLCHNLIEAMAAGAIPVLQYDRYLSPELEDGVNCFSFRDERELRDIASRILTMSGKEVHHLREGVKVYYDRHQAPGRFAEKLAAAGDATLLMNAYRVPRS